jgi:hypothetical protein
MTTWLARSAALLWLLAPGPALALVIDTFETEQSVSDGANGVPGVSTLTNVAGAIGDSREVSAIGSASIPSVTTTIVGGQLSFGVFSAQPVVTGAVDWILSTPLDLTQSQAFSFEVRQQLLIANISLTLFSGTGSSMATLAFPAPALPEIPLSAFGAGPGGPVDLAAVDRIRMSFESYPFNPGYMILVGPFQTLPEPGPALAWATLCLLAGGRLANAFRGVGRFGHERAVAARAGRGRRDRRDGVLQAG